MVETVKPWPFLLSLCALLGALSGSVAVWHQHTAATFGALNGLPDPSLAPRPASLRAVNVALEQYADLTPVLAQLRPFGWLRQTFAWNTLEPTAGVYDWAQWDSIVSATHAADYELIAVLNFSPAWARAEGLTATAPPRDPQHFAAFAGAFAARYGEQIDVYQIWDEPNLWIGWGEQPPAAAQYAALLEAAYQAIHAADPTATVLTAALAPTTEAGPDNFSDLIYLQQLYDLGAATYFDGAAGKPYGFYTGPLDRQADAATLNFSRLALLRQVMERNGDGHKLLWGGNFGWNTLPSPWGEVTPAQQSDYTLAAFVRAETEWPWAGPLALENYQPAAPQTDLRWGFALADAAGQPAPLLETLRLNPAPAYALAGNWAPNHPAAHYTGAWEFSALGADIPEDYPQARLTFQFAGNSDFALRVRRGDYRGNLYVSLDGQPANRLPRDERGAYLILTAPELNTQVETILVASNLDEGVHTVVIEPERGWDQWALVGFSVGRRVDEGSFYLALTLLSLVFIAGLAGVWHFGRALHLAPLHRAWNQLGAAGQWTLTTLVTLLLALTSWLTWGEDLVQLTRRTGDTGPLLLTALTAGLFYFSPSLLLTIALLLVLGLLFYLRPLNGLVLVTLLIPFYLQPPQLWRQFSSPVELTLALTLFAWVARHGRAWLKSLVNRQVAAPSPHPLAPTLLDYLVLTFTIIGLLSALAADLLPYAVREWRLVFLEPALYYLLLRALLPSTPAARWRVLDAFILGATLMALVGLYQYATGTNLITAEEGVARLRSVYGSPNNVALYLGRALPLALAFVAQGRQPRRRLFYALCAGVMALTFVLTFSKGGLLLGLPAALAVLAIGGWGKRGAWLVGAGLVAGLAALPIISTLPRFADLFNLSSGTSFFRVKLWSAAWQMALDHPWLGVGPDNFLYQYRSRYIWPEAWQEPNLSHPHNLALDFLSRLGVPGLLVGLGLFGAWAQRAWTAWRTTPGGDDRAVRLGILATLAALLAHGLVDHALFLPDLTYAAMLLLAWTQRPPAERV